jgi:tetratricopeptide (TPR) repeat protein
MTSSASIRACRSRPPVPARRIARRVAPGAMIVAGVLAGGCSLPLLGGGDGPGAPKLGPPREPKDAAEARERVASHPAEPYWHYRLARFLLAADSTAAAEAALESAVRHEAGYAPALSLLSKLYFESGRHEKALRLLEPVRSHPESYPEDVRQVLLAGLALHHDAVGRADLAAAALPGVAGSKHAGPARVYLTLRGEHPDSAAGLSDRVLRDDPRSAVNLNNYGITRLRAADPRSARRAFLEAIERDPRLPGPYYNLAILEKYYALDDEAAQRWFRDYRKRSHQDPDSLSAVFDTPSPQGVARKEP